MRRFTSFVLAILAVGCTSPMEGDKGDFRFRKYGSFERYSPLIGEPIVLWTREDGAQFLVESGMVRCEKHLAMSDGLRIYWQFRSQDGTRLAGGLREIFDLECELDGGTGLRFPIGSTGETIYSEDEMRVGDCLEFSFQLPTGPAWENAVSSEHDDPFPEGFVFPRPMPKMTVETWDTTCFGRYDGG